MGVAFDKFQDSLNLVSSLMKLERGDPPIVVEQDTIKGLRGGVAVLLVASFEYYLKILFKTNISKINSVPPLVDFDKLPGDLKVKTVFYGLEKAMKSEPYGVRNEKVDRIDDIMEACKQLIAGQVNPETFAETGSNPNSSTVKRKFKEVGIPNIFDVIHNDFTGKWGTRVVNTFIADKLDEIVRVRHVVAHTASTLDITKQKQNEALKFMKILAEILEKTLEKHIELVISVAKKNLVL